MAGNHSTSGSTRSGTQLADGLSQSEYDAMMHKWHGRFPHGLSGSDLETRFRDGGIAAALHRVDNSLTHQAVERQHG